MSMFFAKVGMAALLSMYPQHGLTNMPLRLAVCPVNPSATLRFLFLPQKTSYKDSVFSNKSLHLPIIHRNIAMKQFFFAPFHLH
jgi:hypothetical protein